MDIELTTRGANLAGASLLALGVTASGRLTPSGALLDADVVDKLERLLAAGELKPQAGARLLVFGLLAEPQHKILLVSLGPGEMVSEAHYRAALRATAAAVADSPGRDAVVTLTEVEVEGRSAEWRVEQAARILAEGGYRFALPMQAGADAGTRLRPTGVRLVLPSRISRSHETAARRGLAVAEGVFLARDLANMPSNICSARYLADTARKVGDKFGFLVEVFERAELEKLGMDALVSLGRAPHADCRMIVAHYRGGSPATRAIVLVGQGLIAGGAGPDATKFDMSGAAAVFGALWVAARLRLALNIVALVPAAETGEAAAGNRAGDVIRSLSGRTIELKGSGARGRLVLCDGLSYAEHFDPVAVVDVAALSAPSAGALGSHASALFANDTDLARELVESGIEAGDRAWQLPLWDDQSALDSEVADLSDPGGPMPEAVTTACFLSRFAPNVKWAHLDVAGTAAHAAAGKGATGRPVPLLAAFLIHRAEMRARHQEGASDGGARLPAAHEPPLSPP